MCLARVIGCVLAHLVQVAGFQPLPVLVSVVLLPMGEVAVVEALYGAITILGEVNQDAVQLQ